MFSYYVVLSIVLFILVLAILFALIDNKNASMCYDCDDCETETTTTVVTEVTTQQADVSVVGQLKTRINKDGKRIVKDPVDKMNWQLKPSDTHYEDASGNVWELID